MKRELNVQTVIYIHITSPESNELAVLTEESDYGRIYAVFNISRKEGQNIHKDMCPGSSNYLCQV